jgi:spermidine/putrescine transport system permease protein
LAATVIDLVLSFPIAYWIAFYAGRRRNFFLIMLLVPFFVSFVIRTVIWKFLLSSDGLVVHTLQALHLVSSDYQILGTTGAVIAGLAYNFLPFTALPLYVSLERLSPALLEASHDLYAGRITTFRKVVLPLCVPGIFAAFLLTFIPAFGDYVNQQVLGGFSNTMVGTVIQNYFLVYNDFSTGSALSVIVMGISLVGILVYGRLLGSKSIGDFV